MIYLVENLQDMEAIKFSYNVSILSVMHESMIAQKYCMILFDIFYRLFECTGNV